MGRKVEKARALLVLLSSLVVLGWGINGASKALSSKFVGPRDAIVVTKSRLVPTIENVQIQDIAVSVEDESPAVHRGILDRGHLQVWSGQGEGVIWNQEQRIEVAVDPQPFDDRAKESSGTRSNRSNVTTSPGVYVGCKEMSSHRSTIFKLMPASKSLAGDLPTFLYDAR